MQAIVVERRSVNYRQETSRDDGNIRCLDDFMKVCTSEFLKLYTLNMVRFIVYQ